MISVLYRSPRPLITLLLIALNALVFVYGLALSEIEMAQFTYKYGLIPAELTMGNGLDEVVVRTAGGFARLDVDSPLPAWGTVFSSMFVHGGLMHFALNMIFLWVAGERVEARLGHIKFLMLYLGAGVAAVWSQVAIDQGSLIPLVGASGAISGALGVYLVAFPLSRATIFIGIWFVSQLFNGFGSVSPAASGAGIAYMAHLGGFSAGVLFMVSYKLLLREPIIPRRPWRFMER